MLDNNRAEDLIHKAVSWAKEHSQRIVQNGEPLDVMELETAIKTGVAHPERVRIFVVETIPFPEERELQKTANEFNLLGEDTAGLTLGYGIYVRTGCYTSSLLAHEFRHVYQYERAGSIDAFIYEYIHQIFKYGYHLAPLEIDTREHMSLL